MEKLKKIIKYTNHAFNLHMLYFKNYPIFSSSIYAGISVFSFKFITWDACKS